MDFPPKIFIVNVNSNYSTDRQTPWLVADIFFFSFHLVLLQAYYSNDFFSGMFCHFLTGNVPFDQRALLDQQLMYSSDMDLDPPDPHYGRSPGAGFRWQKSPNTGIDQKSSENLMLKYLTIRFIFSILTP